MPERHSALYNDGNRHDRTMEHQHMRDVLEYIDEWTSEGEQVAVATVVSAAGSTPRPVGAKLVVTKSGKMQGSVSGGCVEGDVFRTAMEVIESGTPQLVHYGISDEMGWEVGLSCGGTIDVFVEPVNAKTSGAA
jgi:xanthine dehydrogenase accessory factor